MSKIIIDPEKLKIERQKTEVARWIYDTYKIDIFASKDKIDLKVAKKIMKMRKIISWEEVKKEIGL